MSKNYRARAASQHRRIIPPNRSLTPTSSQPIAEVSKSRPWTSNQANASSSVRLPLLSQAQEATKASEAAFSNAIDLPARKRQRTSEIAEEKGEADQDINVAAAYSIFFQALDNWLEMVLKQKQARQQFDFHSKFEQAVPTHPKFIAIVEAFKEANLKVEKAQAAALEAGEEIARLTFKKLALKPIVEVQRIQEIREIPVEASSEPSVDAAKAAAEKEKEERRERELEQLKNKISGFEGNKNAMQGLVERLKMLESWREQEEDRKSAAASAVPPYRSDSAISSEKPGLNAVSDAHTHISANQPPATTITKVQSTSDLQLSDAVESSTAPDPLLSHTPTEAPVEFSRKAKLNAFISEVQRRIAALEAAQAEINECFDDINNTLAMEREDRLIRQGLRGKRKRDVDLTEEYYVDGNQDKSRLKVKEGPNAASQGVSGQGDEDSSALPVGTLPAKPSVAINPRQALVSSTPSQPDSSIPVGFQSQPPPHSQPASQNPNPPQEVSISHVQTVPMSQLPALAPPSQPSIPVQTAFTESTSSFTTTPRRPSSVPPISFAVSPTTGPVNVSNAASTPALAQESPNVPSAFSPYPPPPALPPPSQLVAKTDNAEPSMSSVSSPSTPTASLTRFSSAERVVPMFNDLIRFYKSLRVDLNAVQMSTAELVQGFARITQEIQSLHNKTSPHYDAVETIITKVGEHATKIENLQNVHSKFGRELHELTGIFEDFRLRFNNNFSLAESFSSSFSASIRDHNAGITELKDAMHQVSTLCRDHHAPQIAELQKEHQNSQQLIFSVRDYAFQLNTVVTDLAKKVQELPPEISATIGRIVDDLATVSASCEALHRQLISHEERTRKMEDLSDVVERVKQQWEGRADLQEKGLNGLRNSVEEMEAKAEGPLVNVDLSSESGKPLPERLVSEDRFNRLESLVNCLQENIKKRDEERDQLIIELSARDTKLTSLQQELMGMKLKMEENRKVGEEVTREMMMACIGAAKEELADKTKEDIKQVVDTAIEKYDSRVKERTNDNVSWDDKLIMSIQLAKQEMRQEVPKIVSREISLLKEVRKEGKKKASYHMMATGSKLQGGQYDDRCTPERSPTPGQFTTGDGSSVEITLAELNSGATHNSPKPATPPLPASDLNIQSVGPSFQQRSTPVSRIGSRPPTPQYLPDTQIKEIGVLQGQAASVQEYGPQSPQIDSVTAIEGSRPRTPSLSPPATLLPSATIPQQYTKAAEPSNQLLHH